MMPGIIANRRLPANAGRALLFSLAFLASAAFAMGAAKDMQERYVQIAEIDIDPAQLEAYKAALREHIETAIRAEPGILSLEAVAERDNPTHIHVFEVYADVAAYKAHLEAPHFKTYKAVTEKMVRSLKLIPVLPVALEAKTK
jgi:quinol monooxygenase YgiN